MPVLSRDAQPATGQRVGCLSPRSGRVSDPPGGGEHRRAVVAPQARRPEQWHPPFSAPFGRAKGARPSGRNNIANRCLHAATCNQNDSVRHGTHQCRALIASRFRPVGRADFLCAPKENRRKETAPDHVARRLFGGGCPVLLAVGGRRRRAVLARLQRLRHPCLARRCAPTHPPPAAMLGHVTRVQTRITLAHGVFCACAQPRRAVGDGSAGRLFEPAQRASFRPARRRRASQGSRRAVGAPT